MQDKEWGHRQRCDILNKSIQSVIASQLRRACWSNLKTPVLASRRTDKPRLRPCGLLPVHATAAWTAPVSLGALRSRLVLNKAAWETVPEKTSASRSHNLEAGAATIAIRAAGGRGAARQGWRHKTRPCTGGKPSCKKPEIARCRVRE